MTVDEVVCRAAAEIDHALAQRWDALTLSLIAAGASEEDADAIFAEQQAIDRAWRAATLLRFRSDVERWTTAPR